MKMVSTDMLLIVKAMNHDLKIIRIMLNCRCRGNETMGRARIKNRVCMCVVYQRVSLSPTLPLSCRFVSFSVRVCACVRGRVRCWSRVYPHRHDGVGWGGAGVVWQPTVPSFTHTQRRSPRSLSLVLLPVLSFLLSLLSLIVVLSVR